MASKIAGIPSMAPFPEARWRERLSSEEWEACLDSWVTLAGTHLSLSASDFRRISLKDESIPIFLVSYAADQSLSHDQSIPTLSKMRLLRKQSFLLSHRLLEADAPSNSLSSWGYLADISRIYGRKHSQKLVNLAWTKHQSSLEISMASLKTSLIEELNIGLQGDLKEAETKLKRLNHLFHTSPQVATFFLAGSDFLDALINCYKIMNPPLRKAILSTTYLCFIGPMEIEKSNLSLLVDQLYSLKSAAEAHKAGPTNINDSLVAELATATPVLKQLKQRIGAIGMGSHRADSVLISLESFRKAGGSGRPAHLSRKKIDKGKRIGLGDYGHGLDDQVHVHRLSLVSQVQDLFPDLGSGFVVRLLDAYHDSVEEVISHLLEESLPPHLQVADRSEILDPNLQSATKAPQKQYLPPQLPTRRNVFDDDEFDQLAVDTGKLHFGRRNPDQTADDVLQDKSNAPNKAAILSALAAFDSDDDERDDTYDVADVGGTVDSATPGNNPEEADANLGDEQDEVLFRVYKTTPELFARDAATRRLKGRITLKEQTGLTDESIEGWAVMLSRDPRKLRRLEAKISAFTGMQQQLVPTSWRASPAGSGTEDSDFDGNNRGRGGGFRGQKGRGGGRGRGNVAGATGDKDTEVARHRKEANKGSRANHNRRDQRAKKMARGGFPG